VALPGGLLFQWLHIPLPWMLGPLAFTLLYHTVSRGRGRWPVQLRNAGLIVIGYSMGRTVSLETIRQALANLPAMVAVTLLATLFCLGLGYLIHRRTGISLASGILGSMPGGLGQMVLLSEECEGADVTVVTFMQMTRILSVVFIVPFVATYGMAHPIALIGPTTTPLDHSLSGVIALLPAILGAPVGAWVAGRLKLPLPGLLGPIITTAAIGLAGYPAPPVPRPLMFVAQLAFGAYLGIAMTLESLRQLGKVLPYAVGGSIALLGFTTLLGFGLTLLTPVNLLSAFLGTAPGGLTEMCVVALTLGADAAFVLAFQLFRLFSILLVAPPLLKWRLRH
jgi:hypothetical protein